MQIAYLIAPHSGQIPISCTGCSAEPLIACDYVTTLYNYYAELFDYSNNVI